jgi:hypothetical protein
MTAGLANLYAFIRSPWGLRLVLALVVLMVIGGAFLSGRSHGVRIEKAAEARRLEAARKDVAKREAKAVRITSGIATKTDAARVEIRTRTVTLIQKVPTYVTPASDAQCIVPVGFLRLYNAAAAGVPTPAGGPVEAPSGVPLSTVLETDVANLGVGYDWRAEALAWREWYPKVRRPGRSASAPVRC